MTRRTRREEFFGDLVEEARLRRTRGQSRVRVMLWVIGQMWTSIPFLVRRDSRTPRSSTSDSILVESVRDLRMAIRAWRRKPIFTAVVIMTLALGIGASTAMFSLVDGVLLTSLPYPESDRLAVVWTEDRARGVERDHVAIPDFYDYQQRNRVFQSLAAFYADGNDFHPDGGRPVRLNVVVASYGIFDVLGVEPVLGRGFTAEEDRPNARLVAVLSHGLWVRQFAGDPDVLGRRIEFGGEVRTVIGVMPPSADLPPINVWSRGKPDIWLPLAVDPATLGRAWKYLTVMGRLRDDIDLHSAGREMADVGEQLASEFPGTNRDRGVWVEALETAAIGDARAALWMLTGAVSVLLLLACANVTNLQLARALERGRELTIRGALGAGRGRLVRQLMVESGMVAMAGALVGTGFAAAAVQGVIVYGPTDVYRLGNATVDARALAFAVSLAGLTALLFGTLPALKGSRPDLRLALGTRSGGTGRSGTLRDTMIAVQVGMAVVLILGAVLFGGSLLRLRQVDPGFDPDRLAVVGIVPPRSVLDASDGQFIFGPRTEAFYSTISDRLRALDAVQSVALGWYHPAATGITNIPLAIEGAPLPPGVDAVAFFSAVSTDYFETSGLPLRLGRAFTTQDREDARPVAVINETLARRYFPAGNAIGARLRVWDTTRTVVGVVGDVNANDLTGHAPATVYAPILQMPGNGYRELLVRTVREPRGAFDQLRESIWAVHPEVVLDDLTTMNDILGGQYRTPRFHAAVLGGFGVMALVIAAVGIFGVMAHNVSQRAHDVGICIALGASARSVLRLVVGRSVAFAAAGGFVGVAVSVAAGSAIEGMLFGISAADPRAYLVVAATIAAVSLLASAGPVVRLMRVDPVTVLRSD